LPYSTEHRGTSKEKLPSMVSAGTNSQDSPDEVAQTLAGIYTESGANLLALVEASPVLLVFLRHFGCSFCRQAISDVADLKGELDKRGVRPVFVHLGTPDRANPFFDYYGMGDVERVSDPEAAVYQLRYLRCLGCIRR
jgi:peroxiredoxin